ncbi:hypothetical protein DIJ64_07365 [Mycobacterium leprae]|uniref:Uncharacterized protein n=1 Tax=Mycobacterium leprae TaxID=1769 RepID=A0AAD0P7W6_MYCLR|nr:hypothetical protein DIJ64_07365 [Mycobacterium leprae]
MVTQIVFGRALSYSLQPDDNARHRQALIYLGSLSVRQRELLALIAGGVGVVDSVSIGCVTHR